MRYLCDPHIIPAVMPDGLTELSHAVERCAVFSQWLHLDVMDGIFAPNPRWPFADPYQKSELESMANGGTRLPAGISYEVHLMTQNPLELGVLFARAGCARILAHVEAFGNPEDARSALSAWKEAGAAEAGLSVSIDTPLSKLGGLAETCDVVQVMSIAEIGFQGKPFDERALSRIEELHAAYPELMVAVDGGVSEATVEALVRAGANRLVVGGAIMKSKKPAQVYARIHERAMRGCAPLEEIAGVSVNT